MPSTPSPQTDLPSDEVKAVSSALQSLPVALVTAEEEIEARFIVRRTALFRQLSLKNHHPLLLKQTFFSAAEIPAALDMIAQRHPSLRLMVSGVPLSMRLRQQKFATERSSSFCAQIKFPGRANLAKQEITAYLEPEDFEALCRDAHGGFMAKRRFEVSRVLQLAGEQIAVRIHIDCITALGLPPHTLQEENLPKFFSEFVILEIELPSLDAYHLLEANPSSLSPLLDGALNLSALQKNYSDKFSLRILAEGAKNGAALERHLGELEKAHSRAAGL